MIHPFDAGLFAWPLLVATVAAWLTPAGSVPRLVKTLVLGLTAALVAAVIAMRFAEALFMLRFGLWDAWNDSILAVSAAWLAGQPMYPAPESGFFYGLLYGPLLYEILAVPQWLFGLASPLAALPAIIAEVAFPFVAYRALRGLGITRRNAALAVAATFVPLALGYTQPAMRSDPLLLLLATMSLTLLPALERRAVWAAAALGVCAGLATALKLNAPIYFIPVLVATNPLRDAAGRRLVLPFAVGGLGALVLPYLPEGAEIAAHWHFLSELRSFPLRPAKLTAHAIEIAAWLAPVIFLTHDRRPAFSLVDRLAFGALAVLPIALMLSWIEAGGLWYVVPLLPVLTVVLGRLLDTQERLDRRGILLLAGFAAAAACALLGQVRDMRGLEQAASLRAAENAALETFVTAHPGATIGIVAGQQSSFLVAMGQRLVFTQTAWMDMATPSHLTTFSKVQLARCGVKYCLIAGGMSVRRGVYQEFENAYERTGTLADWEVWTCRTPQPDAGTGGRTR